MTSQDKYWSQAAQFYERDFIDPYRADVRNPLLSALKSVSCPGGVAVDLGCGIGPLLPILADSFTRVEAVDFAAGMIERAKERVAGRRNVTFHQLGFTDLAPLHGSVDVAVAVNSLVLPDVRELDAALAQVKLCLRPGGVFLGIVPAMDAVHYCNMLFLDRALASGKPLAAARKNAAHAGEFEFYDFAFGQFRFEGLEQHFWQPFEVRFRLRRAGFRLKRLRKVLLSWRQFAYGDQLVTYPPPWDWFFLAHAADDHA